MWCKHQEASAVELRHQRWWLYSISQPLCFAGWVSNVLPEAGCDAQAAPQSFEPRGPQARAKPSRLGEFVAPKFYHCAQFLIHHAISAVGYAYDIVSIAISLHVSLLTLAVQ